MAQQRQSGMERFGAWGNHDLHHANGSGDHVSVGIRATAHHLKQPRLRRSARSDKTRYFSLVAIIVFLFIVLVVTVLAYYYLSIDDKGQF